MKPLKLLALLSLSGIAFATGGAPASLTVSSGTFLAVDGFTNANGNFRQAAVIGDGVNPQSLKVDSSSRAFVSLEGAAGATLSASNPIPVQTTGTVRVDGSGVTQPVSGTVTANAGTGNFSSLVVNVATVSFNGSAQPISGTVTANAGTGNFNSLMVNVATVSFNGSAQPISGTVTANAGTGNFNSLMVNVATVSFNGSAQPISGTVTANAGTGSFNVSGSTVAIMNVSGGSLSVTGGTMTIQGNNGAALAVAGDVASGSSDSGNPVKQGGVGRTTLPTAVSDGQRANHILDKFGRDMIAIECPRDLRISTSVTLSATTSETVLLSSGAASVFNDMLMALVVNTSGTAARIDFRSGGGPSAGAIDFPIYVPAGDTRGYTIGIPWPQSASASNWTVQSSASVTDIRIAALFCKNK